ncbi:rCG30958, partial [Rattus norvegicus]
SLYRFLSGSVLC